MSLEVYKMFCPVCGQLFSSYDVTKKFCSMKCKTEHEKREQAKQLNKKNLNDIMKMAADEHLSYGQFVAKYRL